MIALMIAVVLASPLPRSVTAQKILDLKPGITSSRADKLGHMIDYWAHYYEVDPAVMVAIIRQESNFESVRACWPAPWNGPGAITCDHGLAQVNQVWIDRWNLNPQRLISDEGYNIYIQARILAWLRHYYGQEQAWYARYHSATPSKRSAYLGQLEAFLGH